MGTTRKFLYGDSRGDLREQDPTDDIQLGGLAMSGDVAMGTNQITGMTGGDTAGEALAYGQAGASLSGLSITTNPLDMGSQQITNLGEATLDHHAITLGQVNQKIVRGGTLKELLLHEEQLDNAEGVLSAVALTMVTNPVAGDTVTLTDGTTTRTYAAETGGNVQYVIEPTVEATMANLAAAITGDGSGAWEAYYTEALDSIDATGVVVIIEKDNDGTESEVYGTWGTPANCQIVDFGGELQYTKKTLTTMPGSDPASTNFGMRRTQSALSPGAMHSVENNDTIYGWDSDTSQWNTMTGASSIPDATSDYGGGVKGKATFDRNFGLSVSTGIAKISLATNKGLGFDGSGDLQGLADTTRGMGFSVSGFAIDLAATNPALSFDGGGALQADADETAGLTKTANGIAIGLGLSNPCVGFDGSGDLVAVTAADGGIERTSAGLRLKIDDTPDTLDTGVNGAKVTGVPLNFKVNGVSTGATVTAGNLDAVTNGGNADSQHTHESIAESTKVENVFTATENVTLGDPVFIDSGGNSVSKCIPTDDNKIDVVGVARTTESATNPVDVCSVGPAAVLSGASPGQRYYLQPTGGIGTTYPTAGSWVVIVGWSMNSTTLFVMPRLTHKRFA